MLLFVNDKIFMAQRSTSGAPEQFYGQNVKNENYAKI